MKPGLVLRFVLSATVGAGVAVGTAAITTNPQIVSTARAGNPVSLTDASGSPLQFGLEPLDPEPIDPLPETATIQLTTATTPTASDAPGDEPPAPWWKNSVPRIPAITQFDGGPLQSVNCTMAAGAMLARLGYGIVTTGSQLRALQGDREGGTNLADLQNAVGQGWGVRFLRGALTPLQLRALLYAGAGAVIGGVYGQLPVDLRLQKSFTGAHAIYIDAFRPPGPDGPAAYYVMDPIGRTWQGYKGGWWPADDVERFAVALGGGRVYTAWTFPGGKVPRDHRILPPDAYPSGGSSPGSPGKSPDARPTATPSASGAVTDPMPTTDVPLTDEPVVGDPPPDVPHFPDVDFEGHVAEVVEPGVTECLGRPPPRGCPRGVIGVLDLAGVSGALGGPKAVPDIRLLYANAIAPGTYRILVESPPDSSADLWFWNSENGADLSAATVEQGILDGKPVSIATINLDPSTSYSFVATARGDGIRSISPVGSLTVRP